MKNYILLSIVSLVCSCHPHDYKPMFTRVYEESVVEFPGNEKIILHANFFSPSTVTLNDNCEFFTISKELSDKRVVKAVFARHENFSLRLNKDWVSKIEHMVANGKKEFYLVDYIDMTTQFFRVYSIKVDEKEIYRNEEAVSDTYWNLWLNSGFVSDYYISISLKLNDKLEVVSKHVLKTKEPKNFGGLLNTGEYFKG